MKLFRKKSRIEILKERYTSLMRKSYKKALVDKKESDLIKKRAFNVFQEIKSLS